MTDEEKERVKYLKYSMDLLLGIVDELGKEISLISEDEEESEHPAPPILRLVKEEGGDDEG